MTRVWQERALRAASITWEFSEFLVDGLGICDLGARLAPTRVAFHDACHGLRGLGLQEQARALAGSIEGVTLVEMTGAQQCCGFGGLFAIKMADISNAMLQEKIPGNHQHADRRLPHRRLQLPDAHQRRPRPSGQAATTALYR